VAWTGGFGGVIQAGFEIKELCHVHLGGVPLGQGRHTETSFDQLPNCGSVSFRVRDVVHFRVGRDKDQGQAVTTVD